MGSLRRSDDTSVSTILTKFKEQVKLRPDKLAIIGETQSLTYSELHCKSKSISEQLIRKFSAENANPVVAVLLPAGLDFISSVLAIFESSRAYAALSVDYPSAKLEMMLEQLGNPLLLTTKIIVQNAGISYASDKLILLDHLDDGRNGHCVQTGTNFEYVQSSTYSTTLLYSETTDLACVYFTSGTTGVPKAVPIEHSAFLHCYTGMAEYLRVSPNDVSLCILNPAFVLSTQEMWPALISGATLRVPPSGLRYDTALLRSWIKAHGDVSIMCMVSSAGEAFFQAEPSKFPSSLRVLLLAGEKLQTVPPSDLPFSIYCSYGSSETLAVTITEVRSVQAQDINCIVAHTLVGKPFPSVDVYILEEGSLNILEQSGQTGEVVVGGASITKGYLNPDAESSSKFLKLENGVRVIRTGDLGYFLPDGELVILNRTDNLIKVSGFRFDLADLESALLQHDAVEKAIAVLEKGETPKLHLFYKLKANASVKPAYEQEISEFLQQRLPHYAFPNSITQVDDFPRNSHGKIDKAALLKKLAETQKIIEPIVTETESIIAEVWSEVLGLIKSEISRQDNFFALGGSSASVLKVISKLSDRNRDFKVQPFNIFKIPVLRNLAEFLDQASVPKDSAATDLLAEVQRYSSQLKCLEDIRFSEPNLTTQAVLVTGATGYLGGAVVLELLAQTEAEVYFIVRSASETDAYSRIKTNLENFGRILSSKDLSKLHCIPGNLALPRFGLNETVYNSLAKKIDQIYHCAAEVHWLKRYEELRTVNVEGTVEIIRFAVTGKVKILHHISTVGVFGNNTDSSAAESKKVDTPPRANEMGYTQSKWVAEMLVWKAIESGLPGVLYRPGIIGCDAQSKRVNANDFITLLFRVCKEIGAYPDHPWKFPYGSLEFTSKSILAISQTGEKNRGKAYLNFQNMLSFEDFYKHFDQMLLKRVSVADWKSRVMATEKSGLQSPIIERFKMFTSISYSKNMTLFDLIFTEHKLATSNKETLAMFSEIESAVLFENQDVQVSNFLNAVFNY